MRSQLKNERENSFLPHRDLNHGPLEPKASVLPMSYTDSLNGTLSGSSANLLYVKDTL